MTSSINKENTRNHVQVFQRFDLHTASVAFQCGIQISSSSVRIQGSGPLSSFFFSFLSFSSQQKTHFHKCLSKRKTFLGAFLSWGSFCRLRLLSRLSGCQLAESSPLERCIFGCASPLYGLWQSPVFWHGSLGIKSSSKRRLKAKIQKSWDVSQGSPPILR